MTTQTIEVDFENLNKLTSQLRSAGAVLKVAKGRVGAFVITITKLPCLASIEEILTYSINSDLAEDTQQNSNKIVAFENVQLPTETDVALKDATKSPVSKNQKKSTKSKFKPEDLDAFDDNDNIPF